MAALDSERAVATEASSSAKRIYDSDLKLEAVRAFLDGNMTRREVVESYGITSMSTFKKWVIAYKREGAAAFESKNRGRPRGSRNAAGIAASASLTSFEDLRIRVENDRLMHKLRG